MNKFIKILAGVVFVMPLLFSAVNFKIDSPAIMLMNSKERMNLYKISLADTSDYSNKGKELYESKCQKCHTLYDPEDFTSSKWKKILEIMAEKAGISQEDKKAIYNYISEHSKK